VTRSKIRRLLGAVCVLLLVPSATLAVAGAKPRPHHTTKRHHTRPHHSGIPQHNGGDHDPDNDGAPSDGDGKR
jgi:hypothetical protein